VNLEVEGVDVRLGDVPVLSDVSMTAESGTFVGLVGPNGAGKTTLLRTANGTLAPDAGTVTVGGDDVHAMSSKAVSRRVATVPQDTAISFEFSVRDIVEMGRYPHRGRFERPDDGDVVERALERAQVADFADRAITEVSGGERQRVLLARALAQDAPVLLLDEPTASLDVTHQVRTLDLVRDLVGDESRTAVAAIHDLTLAGRYCDEIVALADGRVVDAGPVDDVLSEGTLADAFGDGVVVASHPVTGTPLVTARGPRADRDGRVHVVGTGRRTARLVARLATAGFAVSLGVVPEGDAAHEAARDLGVDAVTVPPFEGVTADARRAASERAERADAVVVADLDGAADANLRVARAGDNPVVVDGWQPAGALDRHGALAARTRRVEPSGALAAVAEAVAASMPAAEAASRADD
jgi:iron complex transport system ATP-binding protein